MKLVVSKQAQYKRFTRSRLGNVFFFAFLFAAGLFSLVPLIYCIVTSFKPLEELLIFPPKFLVRNPTLENFVALPGLLSSLQVPVLKYVFNSLFISVVSTVLQIFACSMVAFAFSKSKIPGRGILFAIVQFALLYNTFTLSLPQYFIFSKIGIINSYWVYILPAIPSSMGAFLMKQYIDTSVPDVLLEAAKIDGAGIYRIYWQIVMPLVKPAWMTLILFSFQGMWATVPGGTIFSEGLKTLPYVLSQVTAGGIARSGSSMAATVILMIPPIVVYFISQSNVMATMSNAGIKD